MATDEAQQLTSGVSRRSVLRGAAVAAAGVATAGAMSAALTGTAEANAVDPQYGWAFCSACSALWWTGGGGIVICQARNYGPHVAAPNTYIYGVNHDIQNLVNTSNPQPDWRWCNYCSVLYWGGNQGYCAAANDIGAFGVHHQGSYTSYDLSWQGPASPVYGTQTDPQGYWRYCTNCSALFWPGPNTRQSGDCPAIPGTHHIGGPTNYNINWLGTY